MTANKIVRGLVLVIIASELGLAGGGKLQDPFLLAVIDGDIDMVNKFLKEDESLFIASEGIVSVSRAEQGLRLAIEKGHTDIVRLLLSEKVNPNIRYETGLGPLHIAAENGRADIVPLLVKHGADVNGQVGDFGHPPLSYASTAEVVYALVTSGADVKLKGTYDNSPLHMVAWYGKKEAAEALLKCGADIDAANRSGQRPLHRAAVKCQKEMVEFLIDSHADINAGDRGGLTPLSTVISDSDIWNADQNQKKNIAEFLISRGAEYNIFDVAWLGDANAVKALLDQDPTLVNTKQGGWKEPVICAAVRGGHVDVVKVLLAHDANTNTTGMYGIPPLHFATSEGNRELVELLLASGDDVNGLGKSGELALHWAAGKGYTDLVKVLIEAGSPINHVAKKPRVDVDSVVENDFDPISGWLRYLEDSRMQKLHRNLQIMGGIRVLFVAGDTPLHCAAQWGHDEIVVFLLANGVAADVKNEWGQTPLHYASLFGHTAIVKALIEAGVDIDAKDKQGRRPLELAELSEAGPHGDTAKLLRNSNAKRW